MQLFKTEMMFMHPPRARPVYGVRSKRVLRYGRGLPLRAKDVSTLPRLCDTVSGVQTSRPFDVDRAA
jgi:hypothetical protein